MAGQTTRWMQHGACIGLMLVAVTASALGLGLPSTAPAAQMVQYREANQSVAQALTPPTADSTIGEAQQ